MRVSLCYELISSAERNKQTARERTTQCTNNSTSTSTSTSVLLLRQDSVTAHAHQSMARRLASDNLATEIHPLKSAIRPICESGSSDHNATTHRLHCHLCKIDVTVFLGTITLPFTASIGRYLCLQANYSLLIYTREKRHPGKCC
jgi:hypothetical protein